MICSASFSFYIFLFTTLGCLLQRGCFTKLGFGSLAQFCPPPPPIFQCRLRSCTAFNVHIGIQRIIIIDRKKREESLPTILTFPLPVNASYNTCSRKQTTGRYLFALPSSVNWHSENTIWRFSKYPEPNNHLIILFHISIHCKGLATRTEDNFQKKNSEKMQKPFNYTDDALFIDQRLLETQRSRSTNTSTISCVYTTQTNPGQARVSLFRVGFL